RQGAPGAADPEPSEARAEGHACGTHEVIHSPVEDCLHVSHASIHWGMDPRSSADSRRHPSGMTV
ncbi:MAG: hypothetical protein ACQETP_04065, partial [Bacteroidota bacterium]